MEVLLTIPVFPRGGEEQDKAIHWQGVKLQSYTFSHSPQAGQLRQFHERQASGFELAREILLDPRRRVV